ncbi:gluconokinase [Actinorhabdospora filicis]|uniref:Gluconokinase n=1 Tax=Actinorhabdospora filicis TaxID=1785913 RepID=A0A9W6SHX9_9ACTN|nr:gluconokinase, GntK/IdnK-type [Actinorhabdospora filicis]GLZ76608.1 gluconokinase [Actinorhabdospora filicis]
MTPIVVMGASGAGKTTVARALAARLGVPFADADDLHPPASVAAMRAGRPLTDTDRWPWLRDVAAVLAARDVVVACSSLKRAHRDVLREAGDVAFAHLDVAADELRRRVAARTGHFMPAALVDGQLAALEPLGPGEHGITIAAATVDAAVDAIAAWARQ